MKIKISTLGELKKYLKDEKELDLSDDSIDLKTLVTNSIGIPPTEQRVCFIVNGRIQKSNYLLQENDSIIVAKMGGAG